MKRRPQTVTDAELAVLKVLWQRGPLSAKAITIVIYPDGTESEFASVHSFLQRLERKGLVDRDRSSFVHSFSAAVSQADIAGQELESLAARLGERSIAPLIMQLVEQKRLSEEEVAEIRKLLKKYSKSIEVPRELALLPRLEQHRRRDASGPACLGHHAEVE